MPKYSIIIPVFNRPDELRELLESIATQTFEDFEVIIIEDGSTISSEHVIEQYTSLLNLKYERQENVGPGLSRNNGANLASGNFLIFLDSDCILTSNYFECVEKQLSKHQFDAFGGPDEAHPSFSTTQKAINYAMTSFLTTGGIRGGKKQLERYKPRSFNMGIRKEVFNKLNGFRNLRFGEDIDLSIRLEHDGYRSILIEEAFVYHKRRSNFRQFFKQVYNSGVARIYLKYLHPGSLKFVHTLPSVFLIGIITSIILSYFQISFSYPLALFASILFIHSLYINKSILVSLYSVVAGFIQLIGYGLGFSVAFFRSVILGRKPVFAFENSFYD